MSPARRAGTGGWWRMASAAYLVSTALGVVMRAAFVGIDPVLPFDHLLHAHSHTLFFGWVGLGVLGLAARLAGGSARMVRAALATLTVMTPAILVAFLAAGYHPVSIAVSTAVMFAWYAAVGSWWWATRGRDGPGLGAIRAGFAYLVLASLGVWVLGWMQATGGWSALARSLAVHAFLLGFGWFAVLSVVGLVSVHAGRLGLDLPEAVVRRAVRWWAAVAWVTFPLAVVGGPEAALLGPVSRIAGVALVYPGALWVVALWRAAPAGPPGRPWRAAAGWFAVAAATSGLVALLGSGALLAGGRQGVVIHLHALYVGFLTTCLVVLMAGPVRGLTAHHMALAAMLLGLAAAGAGAEAAGMWTAAAASVALWAAGAVWSAGIADREGPGPAPDAVSTARAPS